MTLRETYMAIEAALWRDERRQKQDIVLAWRVAALTRAKRLPPLKQLLSTKAARRLSGSELEKRRSEFKTMAAAIKNIKIPQDLLKDRKPNDPAR